MSTTPSNPNQPKATTPKLPTDDEMNALRNGQGWSGLNAADSATALRADCWDVMNTIMKRTPEGEKMRAADMRAYSKAESVYDELTDIIAANTVNRTGVMAPTHDPASAKYREGAPLAKGQTFAGYAQARGFEHPPEVRNALEDSGRADLSLTKYLRGAFTGDWRDADAERIQMALSGGSAGAGGVMLPTVLSTRIIDLARKKTRVMQAGATTVPMESRTLDVARWLTDPTLAWRAENAAIAETDPTMDKVTLIAKSLAAYTKVSRELVEDTDIEGQLEAAFGSALALSVDLAALYGTGDGTATAVQPRGIKTDPNVTKTPLATNGATPTWAALVNSVGRIRDNNEEPNAQILADRTLRTLSLITATDGSYVQPPAYLDDIERYTTNQVPSNLTVGTSSDTSDVFTADWNQLMIGVRTELQITLLTERFMPDNGQYGFVAWWRGDMVPARPKAFDVVTGVRP
ncbi:phage major capsid protein [Nocardioides zhouii]|uniref:Phage major capsid protein n=1 Tax=Nocardioides zhouii TaxID=1168729 RepID=A0A4Q2TBC1_9ACTN|nr:phage major capsid protein [Nocardioides zhouii]RYC14560.1 phage major capsid protein [Nocardioides zhouii]